MTKKTYYKFLYKNYMWVGTEKYNSDSEILMVALELETVVLL